MPEITYQPKGSMCCNCTRASLECSDLPFNKMKVIEHYGDARVVKCDEYKQISKEE